MELLPTSSHTHLLWPPNRSDCLWFCLTKKYKLWQACSMNAMCLSASWNPSWNECPVPTQWGRVTPVILSSQWELSRSPPDHFLNHITSELPTVGWGCNWVVSSSLNAIIMVILNFCKPQLHILFLRNKSDYLGSYLGAGKDAVVVESSIHISSRAFCITFCLQLKYNCRNAIDWHIHSSKITWALVIKLLQRWRMIVNFSFALFLNAHQPYSEHHSAEPGCVIQASGQTGGCRNFRRVCTAF